MMLNRLVEEIDKALDNDLYVIALTNALILPDICGKAKYPKIERNSERYKKWYQEYIGQYEQCFKDKASGSKMPYLSADIIYSLRCSLLHEGNPNVDKKYNLFFRLIIDEKNSFGIYADMASCNANLRSYDMNIRRICMIICRASKTYYNDNKEKFNFFNYCIYDIKKEYERILKDND